MRRVKLKVNYKYQESYIPPRCRKPRYKETSAAAVISFPCVVPEEAPVAFRHMDCWQEDVSIEYRLYKKQLYTRIKYSEKYCGAKGWWPYEAFQDFIMNSCSDHSLFSYKQGMPHDEAECRRYLRMLYQGYLLIETEDEMQVWEKAGEPRYYINTFGLGHNHASTGYFISTFYNKNVRKEWYFTALQHDAVVKKTLEVAAARGDTNSFENIRNGPVIEVLIPEAVRCSPNKEAGDGCSLMNQIESVIEGTESSGEAGILAIALTMANF